MGMAVVIAAICLWWLWPDTARGDLGEARSWADDDAAWVTALQAGQTSAEVSDLLLRAADEDGCGGDVAARCERLLQTAAWTRVSSVALLRCTRPGVFAFRADLRRALDALVDGDGLDEPPPVPACD